jgi:hypothetical protein
MNRCFYSGARGCSREREPMHGMWVLLVAGLLSLLCGFSSVQAQNTGDDEDVFFRNHPDADKYALIITGAAASEEIRARFRQWSLSLYDVLGRDYGYDQDAITLLIEQGQLSDNDNFRVRGSSRREDIESTFNRLATELEAGDQLTIFLIGHGSDTNELPKFNIVGPDITGGEFAELLLPFNQQDVVILNMTSASFGFSEALSGRGRVIVSATRSRAERYDPMFARYLIEALDSRAGDRDKNERVSVLEAFMFASQSVQGWYSEQGRLPTERAVLDDNGDGLFSIDPGPGMADGSLAEIAYFDVTSAGDDKVSAEALQLRAEMQDLERSVFLLRGQKTNYLEDDYWNRMEALLIELARKTGRYNELP